MPRPLKEEEGKRYALAARTSLALNQALKEAAKTSGRSVAQEVELRLELSFALEKHDAELEKSAVYNSIDRNTRSLLLTLEGAIGAAMLHAGANWIDDVYSRAGIKAAIDAVRAKYFLEHPLGLEYSDIDIERLTKSAEVGRVFGKLLATSALSKGGRSPARDLVETCLEIQRELDEGRSPEPSPRQPVALDDLNGVEQR